MIFSPRFPAHPPKGRIDNVIYWGASSTVASYAFYFVDLSTGDVGFLPAASLPGGNPTGPAGGDLGGTYPNPTVDNVPDGALSANVPLMTAGVLPAVDGHLLTAVVAASCPDGALSANVPIMTAGVLPAVSGVNLTNLPLPHYLQSGNGNLDGSGYLTVSPAGTPAAIVPGWGTSPGVGPLYWDSVNSRVASGVGGADAGKLVYWIAF